MGGSLLYLRVEVAGQRRRRRRRTPGKIGASTIPTLNQSQFVEAGMPSLVCEMKKGETQQDVSAERLFLCRTPLFNILNPRDNIGIYFSVRFRSPFIKNAEKTCN